MPSELKLIECLGFIIFHALDFGLHVEEERRLSPDLEQLIEQMTALDDHGERSTEADDEGIERDSGESDEDPHHGHVSLTGVIKYCARHLGVAKTQDADSHYRAVCRALVAETLELSNFLEKVSRGTKELRTDLAAPGTDLDQLKFTDWARLWGQVIRELRHGVQLKKVHYSRTPVEFELTPYEILMDDIRSRRYTLNKVAVDGDIPPIVKKDAHALILEFIRSRPPLRNASERRMKPRVEHKTPHEKLLESIRVGKTLRSASPVSRQESSLRRVVPVDNPDSSSAAINEERSRTRRLIKVDFSRLQDDDDEEANDDSDHHHDGDGAESDGGVERTSGNASNPWHRTAYDLATQCPSRRASMRRHTIMICEPVAQAAGPLSKSQPGSRPASRGSPRPAAEVDVVSNTLGLQLPELSLSRSSLQEELFQSKQWKHDCLSLTLDEIVHIRSVLTKAELESLPVEGHVKEDAEKGKVCFLCMKTRFGIFGPWGQKCKLCKRTVCAKCHSKMRIPTEHFAHVPVVAISPSQLASPDDPADQKSHDAATFSRTLMSRLLQTDNPLRTSNTVGSAPSSPKLSRADTASVPNSAPGSGAASMAASMVGSMADSTEGPVSLPALSPESNSSDRRAKFNRSKTLGRPEKERLRGLEMIVCLDCKTMVLEIIKSSRTTRTNTIRNLTLNLSPVY